MILVILTAMARHYAIVITLWLLAMSGGAATWLIRGAIITLAIRTVNIYYGVVALAVTPRHSWLSHFRHMRVTLLRLAIRHWLPLSHCRWLITRAITTHTLDIAAAIAIATRIRYYAT